jgi:hypothetical protein
MKAEKPPQTPDDIELVLAPAKGGRFQGADTRRQREPVGIDRAAEELGDGLAALRRSSFLPS